MHGLISWALNCDTKQTNYNVLFCFFAVPPVIDDSKFKDKIALAIGRSGVIPCPVKGFPPVSKVVWYKTMNEIDPSLPRWVCTCVWLRLYWLAKFCAKKTLKIESEVPRSWMAIESVFLVKSLSVSLTDYQELFNTQTVMITTLVNCHSLYSRQPGGFFIVSCSTDEVKLAVKLLLRFFLQV